MGIIRDPSSRSTEIYTRSFGLGSDGTFAAPDPQMNDRKRSPYLAEQSVSNFLSERHRQMKTTLQLRSTFRVVGPL